MKSLIKLLLAAALMALPCEGLSALKTNLVNIGTTANDGTGTANRTAWRYVNTNLVDLDSRVSAWESGTNDAEFGALTSTNFAGNGAGLTNGYVPSIVKIISQSPPVNGDTNWFGPWTPGTTTAGLQEAWDSVPKGTNQGPFVSGIELRLQDGYYFFTNRLEWTNNHPIGLTLSGANLLSTKLVYAGTESGISTIKLVGSGNSLGIPWHITIKDLGFSAINNTTNALVEVTNYSDLNISRANFTSWQVMTNQEEGAGVSLAANSISGITNFSLVGLITSGSSDHGTVVESVYFTGLATGWDARNDHISAFAIRSSMIGNVASSWPATSRYSLGAVVVREGGLDSAWFYCHFYAAKAGFVLLEEAFESPMLYHAHFESCSKPMGNLAGNIIHSPVAINPVNFGNGTWSEIGVYSVSNSPNYGFTGAENALGVVYGKDQSDTTSLFQVKSGNTRQLNLDQTGQFEVAEIMLKAVGADYMELAVDSERFSFNDKVNDLNPAGDYNFTTGVWGFASINTDDMGLATNAAPGGVTVGTTPPVRWMSIRDKSTGTTYKIPVW